MPNAKPKRPLNSEPSISPDLHPALRFAEDGAGAVRQVTVHEAKTKLSQLLKAVENGETVVIARGATPVARLVGIAAKPRRQFGRYRGLFEVGPAFFEPLPEDELRAWEGG